MEYNQLVIERIVPLFKGYDLLVVEEYKNYFRFKSNVVEATISYNELDRTSLFEIGKAGEFLYPLNDKLIKQVFGSDAKVNQVTKEIFVDNIALFLKSNGSALLSGDESKLLELKLFSEKESEVYTFQILQEQNLAAANKAWENGNYKEFIKMIDQTNKDKLPSSYQLKYKIANQKI
ncbi:MAG TPA: hypothetical protein PKN06_13030 [Chitinophagaceae bacterium]|jgi:hypothetical protein|nr:MAG: hypothetical protein BWY38_03041 [Ignavibacteria bacterium ADurb.Bin266]HNO01181.1 hypothetical protein [Chitinophagaceae bacterium]